MKRIILTIITIITVCSCNKFTMYDGPACFYFDTDKSSTTSINELGEFEAEYYVHYIGEYASQTNTVTFSVTPGDGLHEGLDYKVNTPDGKLSFLPGFTDLAIRIKWLPNSIDKTKDNSVTINLESVDNPDAVIGLPGPAQNNKSIKLIKYKN